MPNLLDYLTIMAGMYGKYRGAREERQTRRFETEQEAATRRLEAEQKQKGIETEWGKKGEISEREEETKRRDIEAAVKLGLNEEATKRFVAAAPVLGNLFTDLIAAYSQGDIARVNALSSEAVAAWNGATAGDATLNQGLASVMSAHIEQTGGVQSLEVLGNIATGLVETGGEQERMNQGQLMPLAQSIAARNMGLQPQAGAPGAPIAGGMGAAAPPGGAPWTTQLRAGDAPEHLQKRQRLVSLYNQLRAAGKGAVAEAMVAAFGTETPREQLDIAIAQAESALYGRAMGQPAVTAGAGEARAAPYDISGMTGTYTGLQRPMPARMELPGQPDYMAMLIKLQNLLLPGVGQALAYAGPAGASPAGAPAYQPSLLPPPVSLPTEAPTPISPAGISPQGFGGPGNLIMPMPRNRQAGISPGAARALAEDTARLKRRGLIR